jgi:DNA-binding response OmpR family regulator
MKVATSSSPAPAPTHTKAIDAVPGTVLVVDDDDSLRKMTCRALSLRHTVHEAADGPAAMKLLESVKPDVILVDVMMPAMNGFDFVSRVRAIPRFKHTPIVFLTSCDQPMDVVRGINAGARSYITKPFKMEALMRSIDKIVSQGPRN